MLQEGISQALAAAAPITALIGTPGSRADQTTGIFPIQMPESATLPAIVYFDVHGDGLMTMDGPDPMQFARVQFSCYGKSYGDSKRLARAVRQFLENFAGILPDGTPIGSMRRVSEVDTFEDAPFIYHTPVDIEIVYQDVTP
jgi:hypothetical protein